MTNAFHTFHCSVHQDYKIIRHTFLSFLISADILHQFKFQIKVKLLSTLLVNGGNYVYK
jgi:hypothetical protein